MFKDGVPVPIEPLCEAESTVSDTGERMIGLDRLSKGGRLTNSVRRIIIPQTVILPIYHDRWPHTQRTTLMHRRITNRRPCLPFGAREGAQTS